MNPEKETDARILIDALLREAGWNPADKSQVRPEVHAVGAELGQESSVVREDDALVKAGDPLTPEQEQELAHRLNQSRHYFNEDNLRRADRRPDGNLIDFVKAALGTTKFKTREAETTENFTPQQASYLSLLKDRGGARGKVELGALFQPPLSIRNTANLGIELLGESGIRTVIEDLNQSAFPARTA